MRLPIWQSSATTAYILRFLGKNIRSMEERFIRKSNEQNAAGVPFKLFLPIDRTWVSGDHLNTERSALKPLDD
jgi:hypothetical protein